MVGNSARLAPSLARRAPPIVLGSPRTIAPVGLLGAIWNRRRKRFDGIRVGHGVGGYPGLLSHSGGRKCFPKRLRHVFAVSQ